MVNPVSSDSSRVIAPANDFPKYKDLSQEKDGPSFPINVSLSEKALKSQKFEGDSPLVEALKKEFDEIFKLGDDKKNLFLKKIENILMKNSL